MEREAVLLDLDGTLIDSAYHHAVAWAQALAEFGQARPVSRIHPLIGMAADELLQHLIGRDDPDLATRHDQIIRASSDRLRPLPGAIELPSVLHDKGVMVMIATTSKRDEAQILLEIAGCVDLIDGLITGDDVARAKPQPDLMLRALAEADVEPSQAVAIGDSAWDMVAATAAGVVAVGVQTGGITGSILAEHGATSVYDDLAAIVAALATGQDLRNLGDPGQRRRGRAHSAVGRV